MSTYEGVYENSHQETQWSADERQRFADLIDRLMVVDENGRKMSQDSFGAIFGVRGSTVQAWEKGSIPETLKLKRIASYIGWTLDDMVFYLKTGKEPSQNQVERMISEIYTLPRRSVARVIEAAGRYLAECQM
ncbi:MAG: helix-turn-helix domain-containing protein [Gloeomargarita sp. SKYBB_i_bin120]|nr:helix-turn-helix domain-containing protein [Gloeomargarita sp. SKYB120]MDW8179227.1 helix-turn-helix domain-containing protein [Gloeomargarita sp. SKYBB_i_bin120]